MNKKQTIFCVFLILSIILTIWNNTQDIKAVEQPIIATKIDRSEDFSDKRYIAQLVNEYADYYGVSRHAMQLIVANESEYDFKAHNPKDGRSGCQAWGLVQFNTCYMGKGMKVEDMKNPHYALDVLARKIAHGNGTAWTTYRTCINKEVIIHNGKQIECDESKVITV